MTYLLFLIEFHVVCNAFTPSAIVVGYWPGFPSACCGFYTKSTCASQTGDFCKHNWAEQLSITRFTAAICLHTNHDLLFFFSLVVGCILLYVTCSFLVKELLSRLFIVYVILCTIGSCIRSYLICHLFLFNSLESHKSISKR